ncbi:MAG: hypothetical protein WCL71_03020, partial [Deltaproteobacteria bacterium]
LQGGLLAEWSESSVIDGIPLNHKDEDDTLHDVLLWAVTIEPDIRKSARTLLFHCESAIRGGK